MTLRTLDLEVEYVGKESRGLDQGRPVSLFREG